MDRVGAVLAALKAVGRDFDAPKRSRLWRALWRCSVVSMDSLGIEVDWDGAMEPEDVARASFFRSVLTAIQEGKAHGV